MLREALKIAWNAHEGQYRKGTDIPYIVHPVEVAVILTENGLADDIAAAGLLHDTLEDAGITTSQIEKMFGKKVCELVKGASEPDKVDIKREFSKEEKRDTWKSRKQHTIDYLKNEATLEVKLITCADKLSNIRSMLKDYKTLKEDLWQKFNVKDKEQHKWYYEGLVDALKDLRDYPMYNELCQGVNELFK